MISGGTIKRSARRACDFLATVPCDRLSELADRLPEGQDRQGTPLRIGEGNLRIDSQVPIDRRPQVVGREVAVLRVLALRVGRADRPGPCACRRRRPASTWPPASGRGPAGGRAVCVPTCDSNRGVRPNSPVTTSSTRLSSPRAYRSSIEGRHRLIVNRQPHLEVVEDVAVDRVRVPVVGPVRKATGCPTDTDSPAPSSRSCSPPRRAAGPTGPAVPSSAGRSDREVAPAPASGRRPCGRPGSRSARSPAGMEPVVRVDLLPIDIPLEPIERVEQPRAVVKPSGDLGQRSEVRDLEARRARIADDAERRVRRPEISRPEAEHVRIVAPRSVPEM